MFRQLIIILTLAIFILSSCVKDPATVADKKEVKLSGAFIMNEGNFLAANGSLSFYSSTDGAIQNNIFKSLNNKDLGDVVQSMTIVDTLGFIVVNNSHKIEVISINSWKSVQTINMPAGASPRYVAFDDNYIYVTNLFGNNIALINRANYQIESEIAVGTNPEMIVIKDGMAYVANSGFGWNNTVSVIDLGQQKIIKTLKVGDNPRFISSVANNQLHVLCEGRYPAWGDSTDTGTSGSIFVIDAVSNTLTDSLEISGHPSRLAYDGETMGYFLNNGNVVSYSIESLQIVNEKFISGDYYGLDVEPFSKNIFTLNANGFAQNGTLQIYNKDGVLKETYETAIGPGSVTFTYE